MDWALDKETLEKDMVKLQKLLADEKKAREAAEKKHADLEAGIAALLPPKK